MHRHLKPPAQAKKVPPPAIPGDPVSQQQQQQHQQYQQIPLYRLGGSISSASGRHLEDGIIMSSLVSSPSLEEGGFNLPRETSVALRIKDEIEYGTTMSSTGSSQVTPSLGGVGAASSLSGAAKVPIMPCPPSVFCATLREPLTHKAAVYYHQQLALQEDQGIDLTQSPGRDSPGSSSGSAGSGSRHSTASLDSGRASSYLTGVSGASIRGSTGGSSACGGGSGSSTSGALSSPRCSSVSSCSIGSSVDRQRNDELIIDWLMEMKFEEYAQLFIAAGYDLPTIARMTPEDLTAIGIKNPQHRERIKQRIDKLQVLDNLPHFVPGSIEEWLQLLRLEEYIQPLLDQNYKTVRDVTQVTWEDLEDIGIVKLGHQKKILLAIKRVKDIISGKWNPGGPSYHQQMYAKPWHQMQLPAQNSHIPASPTVPPYFTTTPRVSSWDDSKIYATTAAAGPASAVAPAAAPANCNMHAANAAGCGSAAAAATAAFAAGTADAYYCTGSNHECCTGNDVVLIKVRQPRGKSLESLEDIHDNSTRSHLTFSHYTTTDYGHFTHPAQIHSQQQQQQQQHGNPMLHQHQHQQMLQHQHQQAALMAGNRLIGNTGVMTWRRSYDDGDITPTNDATRELMYEEGGGGTLPRQQRGILQRAVLNTMPPLEHHHHYMNAAAAAEYVVHAGGLGASGALDAPSLPSGYLTGSPLSGKKIAPDPPRRHCSMRSARTLSSEGMQQIQQLPASAGVSGGQQGLYYGPGPNPMLHHGVGHSGYHQGPQSQQQPIYANYATIQQTTAEIHHEKYHDNKSNSSIDSIDTIPFANENTGTIKQRLLNRQDHPVSSAAISNMHLPSNQSSTHLLHSSSSSSSSSASSTNTIANLTHSFHTLKTSTSLHDTTHAHSLMRSESLGSTTSGGGAAGGLVHLRSPTLQYPPALHQQSATAESSSSSLHNASNTITTTVDLHMPSSSSGNPNEASASGSTSSQTTSLTPTAPPKVSVNVLNDIGNMLANLTDELDAMLEEEKRAGLNIDSE